MSDDATKGEARQIVDTILAAIPRLGGKIEGRRGGREIVFPALIVRRDSAETREPVDGRRLRAVRHPAHRRGVRPDRPRRDHQGRAGPRAETSPTAHGKPPATEGSATMTPPDCCGCCGRDVSPGRVWCDRCSEHVSEVGPLWERTFYALHGRDCPYQLATKRGEPR